MASSMIHIAVAKEINKELKRKEHDLLIGAIAPDISKHINENKIKSHFLDEITHELPNLERFLNIYKDYLNDDFVMGYYIHLYTDYLWFKYFVTEFLTDSEIIKLDGSVIKITPYLQKKFIYNDYTNLNVELLDKYELDLSMFYRELPVFEDIIKEIPMDKINIIVDAVGVGVRESVENKEYVFTKEDIDQFIQVSVEIILGDLLKK